MDSGQTVHVLATDPSSVLDFKAFAARTGHQLLEAQQVNDEFSFLLQKA
jgi:tRNA 2-thiouridine synthesizing protein A